MLSAQPEGNAPLPVGYNPDEFWLRTLLRWYIGLVIRPSPTIREIVERRPVWAGLVTLAWNLAIWSTLWLELVEDPVTIRSSSQVFRYFIPTAFSVVPVGILFTPILAVIAHTLARLIGGRGRLKAIYSGLTMSSAAGAVVAIPGVITVIRLSLSEGPFMGDPALRTFVGMMLFAAVWVVALNVLLVRTTYGLSAIRSSLITLGTIAVGLPVATVIGLATLIAMILLAIPVGLIVASLFGLATSIVIVLFSLAKIRPN